ncbi:hypothetical protein [Candidatus Desulforudis audaxviator]|uniref:hypothetical protein n=1 Tax=Candidatus Desulforudis audaxviator TaxID=471827 RepID=UPI0005A236B0|nr:hypothetical protein [Candidatus Desulforudis audaxviator]
MGLITLDCCRGRNVIDQEALRRYLEKWTQRDLKLYFFHRHIDEWLSTQWPIFFEEGTLAFHAPVGNAALLMRNKIKADYVISGFCVAGEAGLKHVKSLLERNVSDDPVEAAKSAFDTYWMRKGTIAIIDEFGLHRDMGISSAEKAFDLARRGEIPLVLTQALCPIVANYTVRSPHIWRVLMKRPALRTFAARSLSNWWRFLNEGGSDNTQLILMGKRKKQKAELERLLTCSRTGPDNTVLILDHDQGDDSLLVQLRERFSGRVLFTRHASHRARGFSAT